jgi:hypothetical protein
MNKECKVCGDMKDEGLMFFKNNEYFCSVNCASADYTVKNVNVAAGAISIPPTGKCKVTNLYVDPLTGKLTIEYDNIPIGE